MAHRVALVRERGKGYAPALTLGPKAGAVANLDPVEEDLVEGCPTGHLPKRPDRHAGGMQVDHERGEVVVTGAGRGLADDLSDVREVRAGGPDLLAGDAPAIPIPDSLGPDRRQVRPRVRLAEKLAGDQVGAKQRGEVFVLLPLVSVAQDGGGDHPQAHGQGGVTGSIELARQTREGGLVTARQAAAPLTRRARGP